MSNFNNSVDRDGFRRAVDNDARTWAFRAATAILLGFFITLSSGCGTLFPSSTPGVGAIFPGQKDAAVKKRAEADKFPSAQESGI